VGGVRLRLGGVEGRWVRVGVATLGLLLAAASYRMLSPVQTCQASGCLMCLLGLGGGRKTSGQRPVGFPMKSILSLQHCEQASAALRPLLVQVRSRGKPHSTQALGRGKFHPGEAELSLTLYGMEAVDVQAGLEDHLALDSLERV